MSFLDKASGFINGLGDKIRGGANYLAQKVVPVAAKVLDYADRGLGYAKQAAESEPGKLVLDALPFGGAIRRGIDVGQEVVKGGRTVNNFVNEALGRIGRGEPLGQTISFLRDKAPEVYKDLRGGYEKAISKTSNKLPSEGYDKFVQIGHPELQYSNGGNNLYKSGNPGAVFKPQINGLMGRVR